MTELQYLEATHRALSAQLAAVAQRIAVVKKPRQMSVSPPYPMETSTMRPETTTAGVVTY
jgi:hypothetical protein